KVTLRRLVGHGRIQHHHALLRIGFEPVAREHTHDEAGSARHQQRHGGGKSRSKPSKARAATSKSSKLMASSGLWLPCSLRTNIIPVGMPIFANTAASWPAPLAISNGCGSCARNPARRRSSITAEGES